MSHHDRIMPLANVLAWWRLWNRRNCLHFLRVKPDEQACSICREYTDVPALTLVTMQRPDAIDLARLRLQTQACSLGKEQ